MSNKYQNAISNIKASDELKEKLKISMEKEYVKKVGSGMKIKKGLIAISTLLATLVCGGVYAGLGGTINGVPVVEWIGIKFSSNYADYEVSQNQIIENEIGKIELESSVCDDGFAILKFNLKIKDIEKIEEKIFHSEWSEEIKDKENLKYGLLFNNQVFDDGDEVRNYSKISYENSYLIIDDQEYFINGALQAVEENVKNEEYTIYQMWFLTEDELKDKNDFTIKLNNVVLNVSGEFFKFDNNFEIDLSKSKAKENTKNILTKNETIAYKKMKKTIDEIKITPLQNIIKMSSKIENVNYEQLSSLANKDYAGDIKYVVKNQDGKELKFYNVETKREIIFEDGRVQEIDFSDIFNYDEELENVTVISTDYLAIEKNENITEINIQIFDNNSYYDTANFMGEFAIDLNNENVKVNEQLEEKNNDEESDEKSNIEIIMKKSKDVEWEEYPEDIEKNVKDSLNDFYGTNDLSDEEKINYLGKGFKTVYSIVENKLYNEDEESIFGDSILNNILYSYTDFQGDYFNKTETETNYNQYNYLSEDNKIQKYENIIKFKTAVFNDSRYDEYSDNSFLKSIDKKTKKQYEMLKAEDNGDGKYFELEKMVVMNGNNTSEEDYKNNSRAKKIKVTVNETEEYIFDLKDTNKAQIFELNYKQNTIAKLINISIEVLEVYGGEDSQDIYISDIQFGVTSNISMGI